MRRTKTLLAATMAGICLAACAPGETEDEAAEGPTGDVEVDFASFEGETLDYIYFTDGPDEQVTRDLIADFEEETGATVNLQILPYDDLEVSLQARLSGDNVPDVARLTTIAPFSNELLDLTRFFGDEYPEEFLPGLVGAVTGPEGEMLAVPSDLTMNGPFVNVEQFREAGVDLPDPDDPWTVEEMVAAAEEVQAATSTEFALAIDKSGHRVSTLLSQFGTTLLDEDGVALDAGAAEEAVGLLVELMETDAMSGDFWLQSGSRYEGANEIFAAEEVPVYLAGNWMVAEFAESVQFEWAVAPNPCAERCGGFPGGKFMAAFERSDNPELAAAFVQWMNRTEQQERLVGEALFLPTRQDLVSQGIDYPQRGPDMEVFLADVKRTPEDTYESNAHPAFGATADYLAEEISETLAEEQDVSTAVEDTIAEAEELVEDAQ